MIKYRVLITVLILYCPLLSYSQQPSLGTSVDYLVDKINSLSMSKSYEGIYQTINFTASDLDNNERLIVSMTINTNGDKSLFKRDFMFSQLDPNSMKIKYDNFSWGDGYGLTIYTKESQDVIKLFLNDSEFGSREKTTNQIKLYSKSEDTLLRISKAFKRAIELCDDRDPFK